MQTHHIVQLTETGGPCLRAVGIRGAISMGHVLNIDHFHLMTGHSQPLDSPVYWSGPFCLSDPARLRAAQERYQSGAMGNLSPSS